MAPVRRSSKKHNEETEQQAEGRATQGRKAKVQETTDEAPATAKAALEAAKATLETITAALGSVAAETGAAATLEHRDDPALSALKTTQAQMKKSNLKVVDLKNMEPHAIKLVEEERVFAVHHEKGHYRSSMIALENGQLYLHCMVDQPPPLQAVTFTVDEVTSESESQLVFLDLAWPGYPPRRVHIRLRPKNPLAKQFLWLCMGHLGHSYAFTRLLEIGNRGKIVECVVGGDYQKNNGVGGEPLDPGLQLDGEEAPNAIGTVWSHKPYDYKSAHFAISTRSSKFNARRVFGMVESGMEIVLAAVYSDDIRNVVVVDCGVVLWS